MSTPEWIAGKKIVMDLASAEEFDRAKEESKKLNALEDPTGENCAWLGAACESIGDAPDAPVEYYELALIQFTRYAARKDCPKSSGEYMLNRVQEKIGLRRGTITYADTREGKEKAKVKPDQVLAKIEALARKKRTGAWHLLVHDRKHADLQVRIADHFELLGDEAEQQGDFRLAEEFYHVSLSPYRAPANEDRVFKKRTRAELMILDEILATPVSDKPLPKALTWSNGQERMQALALHGRFQDADELLDRSEATHDEWDDRSMAVMSQMEWIGDQVKRTRPDSARWFYKKAADRFQWWVSCATSGGEGMARSAEPNTAAKKLAAMHG